MFRQPGHVYRLADLLIDNDHYLGPWSSVGADGHFDAARFTRLLIPRGPELSLGAILATVHQQIVTCGYRKRRDVNRYQNLDPKR